MTRHNIEYLNANPHFFLQPNNCLKIVHLYWKSKTSEEQKFFFLMDKASLRASSCQDGALWCDTTCSVQFLCNHPCADFFTADESFVHKVGLTIMAVEFAKQSQNEAAWTQRPQQNLRVLYCFSAGRALDRQHNLTVILHRASFWGFCSFITILPYFWQDGLCDVRRNWSTHQPKGLTTIPVGLAVSQVTPHEFVFFLRITSESLS